MKKGLFLGAFKQFFSNIYRRKSVPTAIEDLEIVSRYVFSKRHFKSNNTISSSVFLPAPDGLTSVFRAEKMSPKYKTEIAKKVKLGRGRKIVGQALVSAASIRSICVNSHHLDVVPEESIHKWHADILNWTEEKAQMKSVALGLAAEARRSQKRVSNIPNP